MRKQYNDGGIRRYTDNAIIAYSHALRTGCRMLEPYVAGNLFFYKNGYEFDSIYEQLQGKAEFRNANEAYGNGTLAAAIQLYQAFLRGTDASQAPQVSTPFYLKQDIRNEAYDDDQGLDFRYEEVPMCPLQKIYYGAPGTGGMFRFFQYMIRFRKEHRVLRTSLSGGACGFPDVSFHGVEPWHDGFFEDHERYVGVMFAGAQRSTGPQIV